MPAIQIRFPGLRLIWATGLSAPAIAPRGRTYLDCCFLWKEQSMKGVVRCLAILAALFRSGTVIVVVGVIGKKGRVPSKTILEANFEQGLVEDVPDSPTARLMLTEKRS